MNHFAMQTKCIEWAKSKDHLGYGRFCTWDKEKRKSKVLRAHRVLWERANGPIPEGMIICHSCDNPSCVNLDHLFVGTPADNARDRDEKGRGGKHHGLLNGRAAISELTAVRIKMVGGLLSSQKLADCLGLTKAQICNIRRGDSWGHVPANTRYVF